MTSKLSVLCAKRVEVEQKRNALEEKYPVAFAKWRDLEEEAKVLDENIKIEARRASKDGESCVAFQDASILVSVGGRRRPVSYNFSKASKVLPAMVFDTLRKDELDPKKVEAAVDGGQLSEKLLRKFAEEGELPTLPVTIRVSPGAWDK